MSTALTVKELAQALLLLHPKRVEDATGLRRAIFEEHAPRRFGEIYALLEKIAPGTSGWSGWQCQACHDEEGEYAQWPCDVYVLALNHES